MDKIQRSGGYMIDLPCFKFGKNIKMHRWDSEGRVSAHMEAHLFAKSQNNILVGMRHGSCLNTFIRCSARSVLCCYRCIFCARVVNGGGRGHKQASKKFPRRKSIVREKGCCGYTELDHFDLDNFMSKMDERDIEPMIVATRYHFMPFPYSQTISRGYGSFVCQSKLWEICLLVMYGVLIGLHIKELMWYNNVDLQSTEFDNHLEASIFLQSATCHMSWVPIYVDII